MPTQENNELLLFNFFTRLREEAGIELDHTQYTLLLRALYLKPLDFENWQEALFALCQLLWLPSLSYKAAFSNLYRQCMHADLVTQIRRADVKLPTTPATTDSGKIENRTQLKEETVAQSASQTTNSTPANNGAAGSEHIPASQTTNTTQEAQAAVWPELNLQVKDTNRPQDKQTNETVNTSSYKEIPFLFSISKTIPFKIRTAAQYWRKLKSPRVKKLTDEIDVQGMIRQYARDGFFYEIKFQQKTIGRQQVVWLSDHGNAMTPFSHWENALMGVLKSNPHIAGLEQYFFQDYPSPAMRDDAGFLLFTNTAHTAAVTLSEAMSKKGLGLLELHEILQKRRRDEPGIARQQWNKKTLVVIYSDGGAARHQQDFERVDAFLKLVLALKQSCKRILWINPVNKTDDTPAMLISYFVQMIRPDINDMRKAISHL